MLQLRLYWFAPLLWFSALVVMGRALWASRRGRRVFVAFSASFAAWIVASPLQAEGELAKSYALLFSRLSGRESPIVSYEEFVAAPAFAELASRAGRPKGELRTVAVGVHPSALQMNGFHTLDAYETAYPLAYKARFRAVIAAELEKDPRARKLFDHWGHRCYLPVAGLEPAWSNEDRRAAGMRIASLDLDFDALRALGGTHVISAYEIADPSFLAEARLVGQSSRAPTSRNLYLYEVRPSSRASTADVDHRRAYPRPG
jgi:hypothetical protein